MMTRQIAVMPFALLLAFTAKASAQESLTLEQVMDDCIQTIDALMEAADGDASAFVTQCTNVAARFCESEPDRPACYQELTGYVSRQASTIHGSLPAQPHPNWIKGDRDRFIRYLDKVAGEPRSVCPEDTPSEQADYCAAMTAVEGWSDALDMSKRVERAWTRCTADCVKPE